MGYKLIALVMIMATLIAASPYNYLSYSSWDDTTRINADVTIANGSLEIGSWKIVCCCHEECCEEEHMNLTTNGAEFTLTINHHEEHEDHDDSNSISTSSRDHDNDHEHECHGLWIGLVLENEDGPPVMLTGYNVEGASYYEVYLYGPFISPGNSGVWGHVECEDLPFPTNVPQVNVYGHDKAIVWIYVEVGEYHDHENVTITGSPVYGFGSITSST